jgi:signal transduction histidine kinase
LIQELKEELNNGNMEDVIAITEDLNSNEQKILEHGKRADSIVKGMLEHSRINSGEKITTDINLLADEYLRLAYHGLRAKDKTYNAEMKTDFDDKLPKVKIIPQDIGRVLLNLINNAFQAVQEKSKLDKEFNPKVKLSTSRSSGEGQVDGIIQITISDNGPGIPSEIQDKIFQPFFTTKPTGKGTGLGLSLSYDIVKAHGGEIEVESKEGEGTEIRIILPIV